MAVGFLVFSGIALVGYGFARWRSTKNDKPSVQRLLR